MDWDYRYQKFGKTFGENPTPFLQQAFFDLGMSDQMGRGAELILPGDGYGRNGLWLASQGCRVEAFDSSRVAVGMAENASRSLEHGVYTTTLLDPVRSLSGLYGSPVDGILSIWFRLDETRDRERVNATLYDRLRHGGFILVVSSQKVTSYPREKIEWPGSIAWSDYSTDSEVRMIGRRS